MIEKWDNDVTKIELGLKTTYITQAVDKNTGFSQGIFFSNKPLFNPEDICPGDVFMEIHNFQGAMSYMKGIVDLLDTWKIEGLQDKIADLKQTIEAIIGA